MKGRVQAWCGDCGNTGSRWAEGGMRKEPCPCGSGRSPSADEKQAHFWYYAERLICGRPVHHQQHATCVRDRGHGPEIECDGYYQPTVEEQVALWRAAKENDR